MPRWSEQRERGAVVAVTTKVVFGNSKSVTARLRSSSASKRINTSFVERGSQANRRPTRKTNGFSKEVLWMEKQLWPIPWRIIS